MITSIQIRGLLASLRHL